MAERMRERCIYCGGEILYTGLEKLVKCGFCGKTFSVTRFQSEQAKLRQALEEGEAAKAALREAEAQRTEARQRLEGAVEALSGIRQGQDTLSRLMRALSDTQTLADGKLALLGDMAGKLLKSQGDMLSKLRVQAEIVALLQDVRSESGDTRGLIDDFVQWSQSIHEEDAARLEDIQTSADRLLAGQRALAERAEALQRAADQTRRTVDQFRDEYRQDKLSRLEKLYHEAENFQRDRAFDRAAESYRKMLINGSTDIEVRWRLVLCHYCVEYQRDDEGRLIPIILNPDLGDPEDLSVRRELVSALDEEHAFYLEELGAIDKILDRYRQVRHRMRFDVFISVKQNDDGRHTEDSWIGLKLYDYLTGKGLKVFNSEKKELLPAGREYEPYIISALISAKAMIVVGTKPEYMNSQWVRNEWSRFQWLQREDIRRAGRTDRLLLCYLAGGMKPRDIPRALNPSLQAIEDGLDAHVQLDRALAFLTPATQEPKPVVPEPKPVKPEPKPVVPEPKPVKPEPKPVVPEPKPVKPEPKPVVPEPKPVVPEPKPVKPEPKPFKPEPKPVVPEPKPFKPEPMPVVPEPKPARNSHPALVYAVVLVAILVVLYWVSPGSNTVSPSTTATQKPTATSVITASPTATPTTRPTATPKPEYYTFADPVIEGVVKGSLGSTTITKDDLKKIGEIHIHDKKIQSLNDLKYMENLNTVWMQGCGISDISALSNLVNLKHAYLYNNRISDISALSNLVNLENLYLDTNQISDISALSNLVNLTSLNLTDNQITDISALSNLVNLETLWLGNNQIYYIDALSNLVNLTRLYLEDNQISNIGALSNLVKLKILWLQKNQISYIGALSNLVNLEELWLDNNQIYYIDALSNLVNLTWLTLDDNQISDFSVLSGLYNLETVFTSGNPGKY